MEYIKNVIETLQDPHLVARFQKYFGIRETSYPEPPKVYQRNGRAYDRDLSPVGHGHQTYVGSSTDHEQKTYVGSSTSSDAQVSNRRPVAESSSTQDNQGSDDETSGSDSAGSHKAKIKALLFQSMTAEGEYTDSDGETRDFIVTKPFWHALFVFGSALGDELFYATFFPLWFWNIDGAVGRRAVLVWYGIMYIGQAMKDVLKIPRPACPPVVRVQKKWALEYGFPSTHSMIGIAMPAALSIFTIERYQYPVILAVIPALFWCLSVCGSRLYLGMHSVLDVLAGLVFGVLVLCGLILPYIDAVDEYLVTNTYSPIVLSIVIALSVLLYPAGNTWTPARGDTVIICAVVLGIYSGAWMNYSKHLISAASSAPPYAIIWPTYEMWGQVLARSSIGLCSVLATRAIFRSLSYATVCALLRLNQQDVTLRRANVSQRQFVIVELSYKFMTYAAVGFDIIYTAPLVFRLIGIERPEFYTEV